MIIFYDYNKKYSVENSKKEQERLTWMRNLREDLVALSFLSLIRPIFLSPVVSRCLDPFLHAAVSLRSLPVGIYISGGFLSPVTREKTMDRYNRKRTIVSTVSAECRRRMALTSDIRRH